MKGTIKENVFGFRQLKTMSVFNLSRLMIRWSGADVDMKKFLSWEFAFVVILALALFIVHEYGHYLAYKILGIPAKLRRSIFVPGVDPRETISVKRWKGLLIALGGFFLSGLIVVLPLYVFRYRHWFVLLLGSIAGSIVDFIWAFSMLINKTVILHSRG